METKIKKLFKPSCVTIIVLGICFLISGAASRPKKQSQSPDLESFLGNEGYIYSGPELSGAEQVRPPQGKIPAYEEPVPPASYEEDIDPQGYEPQDEEEAMLTPEEEIASLKEKLRNALKQLTLAEKKLKQSNTGAGSLGITQTYIVKKGDSLWRIAKKKEVYDNPSKWLLLYHANRDQIYDPNLIYPFSVLMVPRLEEYERKTK